MTTIVDKHMIRTHLQPKDWKEAAKLSGELLLENDYIEKQYIDKMIETVEEYGMYILVAPGVAFFHARPEHGAKKTGLSLVTSKEGVEFGVEDKDPVKLMFAMSATDKNSHLELLSGLSKVLQDAKTIDKLAQATTSETVVEILKSKGQE